MLTGAFGHHDHGAPALRKPVAQRFQQSARPFELEGHLGDEHVIDIAARQRGIAGDEARIAAHEFHQPHAVHRARCLDVGTLDGLHGGCKGRLEAEAFVEKHNVVVDGLRNADDRLFQPATLDFLHDLGRAPQRAVPADDEEDVHLHVLQRVHHFTDVLLAARAAEQGAAEIVRLLHRGRLQNERRVAVALHEPLVAEAKAVDAVDAVLKGALVHDAADDVIQSGGEAAAGDDAHGRLRRIEVEHLAGARFFEGRRGVVAPVLQHVAVVEDSVRRVRLERSLHAADPVQR